MAGSGASRVWVSQSERLILAMLCDVHQHLKMKGDIDSKFGTEAIYGGHFWGLKWKFPGLFHGHEDREAVVSEVVDVLDMWSFLETGYAKLSKKEKERIAAEDTPFGKRVTFFGFDGNNEAEHMGIARFLIEQLDRFLSFKGRDLNSHMPTIQTYRRMLAVFEPIRETLIGRELSADQIIKVLKGAVHP
jgi:uncharacterized protein YfbU (UPF0304 family)